MAPEETTNPTSEATDKPKGEFWPKVGKVFDNLFKSDGNKAADAATGAGAGVLGGLITSWIKGEKVDWGSTLGGAATGLLSSLFTGKNNVQGKEGALSSDLAGGLLGKLLPLIMPFFLNMLFNKDKNEGGNTSTALTNPASNTMDAMTRMKMMELQVRKMEQINKHDALENVKRDQYLARMEMQTGRFNVGGPSPFQPMNFRGGQPGTFNPMTRQPQMGRMPNQRMGGFNQPFNPRGFSI